MVAALYVGDLALLGRALDDRIAEPARAPLLPGLRRGEGGRARGGRARAHRSPAAGPTTFALADGDAAAPSAWRVAMAAAYAAPAIECERPRGAVDRVGARVVDGRRDDA